MGWNILRRLTWLCIASFALPMMEAAAGDLPTTNAAASGKKFFPLDHARGAEPKAGAMSSDKASNMRSDSSGLKGGFMRIDRTRAASPMMVEPQVPAVPKPDAIAAAPKTETEEISATESEEIEGLNESYNPILALFDSEGDSDLVSFDEAMHRAGRGAISGLMRHLVWPIPLRVKQEISSGYGMRKDPFHGRMAFHGGIDIAADIGTPVLATADGVVAAVKTDPRYGNYVTLQHSDGTLTRYGHLSAQRVAEGQRVKAGQVIGAVGSSGRSTGPHLDYRVSKNNTKYDPLTILTIPAGVPTRGVRPESARRYARNTGPVITFGRGGIASNPTPKEPMVIQVR